MASVKFAELFAKTSQVVAGNQYRIDDSAGIESGFVCRSNRIHIVPAAEALVNIEITSEFRTHGRR